METLDQYLEKQLKNPKFKKEWDASNRVGEEVIICNY